MSRQQYFKDQQFDPDLWPCDLNINRCHLLSGGITCNCTKFGNFQAKGSTDIEIKNIFSKTSSLTLTSNWDPRYQVWQFRRKESKTFSRHRTAVWPWRLTIWPKILNEHRLVYRLTDWSTGAKQYALIFQRGGGGHIMKGRKKLLWFSWIKYKIYPIFS